MQDTSVGTYPIADTNFDWIQGCKKVNGTITETPTEAFNVESIATHRKNGANELVQTDTITIPSGITAHQLYCKSVIAGTGTITYDFSADGGSTWDTAQALDTKNSFGATTGTSCKIKINLNGSGDGNNAEAKNYGVIIYT